MQVPVGLTERLFADISARIRSRAAVFGVDMCVHGSRASGTALPDSDLDVAIRVPETDFEAVLLGRFPNAKPGTAKERTMLHARAQGKIQTGELGLSGLRRELEQLLGMKVQISVVRVNGPFDRGPYIPLSIGEEERAR